MKVFTYTTKYGTSVNLIPINSYFGYQNENDSEECKLEINNFQKNRAAIMQSNVMEALKKLKIELKNSYVIEPEFEDEFLQNFFEQHNQAISDFAILIKLLDAIKPFDMYANKQVLVLGNIPEVDKFDLKISAFNAILKAKEMGITDVIVTSNYIDDLPYKDDINYIVIGKLENIFTKLVAPILDNSIEFYTAFNDNSGLDFSYNAVVEANPDYLKAITLAVANKLNLMVIGHGNEATEQTRFLIRALTPLLTEPELLECKKIYSRAGMIDILDRRSPIRVPHQTSTIEGICGGGTNCNPGEISLAHNGILLLEDAAEFKTSVLQMLRVPLDTHQITLCRGGISCQYPAKFQLVAITDPCPCGNFDSDKVCLCSAKDFENYWRKLKPIADRCIFTKYTENNKIKTTLGELRHQIKQIMSTKAIRDEANVENILANDLKNIKNDRHTLMHWETLFDAVTAIEKYNNRSNVTVEDVKEAIKLTTPPIPLEI